MTPALTENTLYTCANKHMDKYSLYNLLLWLLCDTSFLLYFIANCKKLKLVSIDFPHSINFGCIKGMLNKVQCTSDLRALSLI